MDKKINVLFDALILSENDEKNGNRSGIFFTANNIFKEFAKNENINLGIYCSNKNYSAKLEEILNKYFPQNSFDMVFKQTLTPLEMYKSKLYKSYKERKNFVTKLGLFLVSCLIKTLPKKNINPIINKYDVYFSPVFNLPIEIENNKSIRKYTLLHDVIPILYPQYFKDMNNEKYWFNQLVKQINENDYYFTNSENTKNDFMKFFPQLKSNHLTTTLLACSDDFKPLKAKTNETLKKYKLPCGKKYIFSLCTLEPRKNLIRAAKCFIEFIKKNNINDMVFILGGSQWDGFIEKMEQEIPEFEKSKDLIIKAGYIDDEDLAPLYSGAEWFVYTSEYEGFGLPPLEAMSCGCPVIVSNRASIPEVVGDAGIMIDYDNDEQHIKAYEDYYYNKDLQKQNSIKGLERAKVFTWKKCADTMIKEMSK